MAAIQQPTVKTVVQTVNGECTVKIELEININLNKDEVSKKIEPTTDEIWAIPDFGNEETFKFGREE